MEEKQSGELYIFFRFVFIHCLFTSPQREIREKKGSWARSWAGWKDLVSRGAACCSFLLMYTSTPGTIIRIKGRVLQRGFPAPIFAPLYFSFDRLGLFIMPFSHLVLIDSPEREWRSWDVVFLFARVLLPLCRAYQFSVDKDGGIRKKMRQQQNTICCTTQPPSTCKYLQGVVKLYTHWRAYT